MARIRLSCLCVPFIMRRMRTCYDGDDDDDDMQHPPLVSYTRADHCPVGCAVNFFYWAVFATRTVVPSSAFLHSSRDLVRIVVTSRVDELFLSTLGHFRAPCQVVRRLDRVIRARVIVPSRLAIQVPRCRLSFFFLSLCCFYIPGRISI